MDHFPDNLYAEWRVEGKAFWLLRDDADMPPERLLQAIWLHQRLCREQLKTTEGASVRVLHPGFQSVEGGPDFRGAVVAIGSAAPVTGDIEVDLRCSGWRAHGHETNPAFANVVLHVVWDGEGARLSLPTLGLRDALDAPLGELSQWLATGCAAAFPPGNRGLCSAELAAWPDDRVVALLLQAALVRLKAKASQFQARARQVGWEQALWEGVFRALGYKHNTWPMQNLAELKPRWARNAGDALQLEARLLGISGLLPFEVSRNKPSMNTYVRQLWDQWWRERDEFSDCVLPRELWRFHGIRPANHPQRRVVLGAQWVFQNELPRFLESWCAGLCGNGEMTARLEDHLAANEHSFWSKHFTLRSAEMDKPQPLMGGTRTADLAVNVFIPWLWSRAAEGGKPGVREEIEKRYFTWPAAQDNSVLREARQRLCLDGRPRLFRKAAAQQGLLQIVQDFCSRSNAVCDGCELPRLLKTTATIAA